MNKYLIVGIGALSLMATTVYALNDNNLVNEATTYKQNCPYHNNNENCPYYDEATGTHNCPNSEDGNCQHNNSGNMNGYGRQGRCHHHNR